MKKKVPENLIRLQGDQHRIVADFIMDAAARLDKDVNDIVIGVESPVCSGKDRNILYIDVYDMDFNLLERN